MLKKFEKFLEKLKEGETERDYSTYTQIIKSERIKRNQTLESMAKGICSISYLSKLENNAIKPSEDYVRALLERVDIKYESISTDQLEKDLLRVVKLYFYGEYESIKEIYNNIDKEHFDSRISMIATFCYLIDNKFIEAEETIGILDEIKNSLIGKQAIILVFLVSEYYMNLSMYREAYHYLKCLKELDIPIDELKFLVDESYFFASFYLRHWLDVYNTYYLLKENETLGYPFDKKIKISLVTKIISGKDFDYEKEMNYLLATKQLLTNNYDIYYYICLLYTKYNSYSSIIKLVTENNLFYRADLLALYVNAIYVLKEKNLFLDFLEKFKIIEKTQKEEIHYMFLKFMSMIIENEDSYSLFEFLKYKVLPFISNHQHYLYDEVYNAKYVDMLMKLSRYKEATIHLLSLRNS